jgi:hypothetical protein
MSSAQGPGRRGRLLDAAEHAVGQGQGLLVGHGPIVAHRFGASATPDVKWRPEAIPARPGDRHGGTMARTVFENLDEVRAGVGTHLGHSDWLEITQDRIDLFAEATGDHQWIHVDPARAAAGPFGAPIAHGYLTMSLSNFFLPQIVEVRGINGGELRRRQDPLPSRCGSGPGCAGAEAGAVAWSPVASDDDGHHPRDRRIGQAGLRHPETCPATSLIKPDARRQITG